jgi:hypothetical protein
MSFVIATPDLVQSAAQDLGGIRSSLAEAAATAAGPTTGIATAAQDEVSVAIASLFGNFGQEFQVVSAQAQAFHQQFVSLMNAGAGAYASAEAANAAQAVLGGEIPTGAQAISNAIASSPIGLGSLPTSGASAVIGGINSFGATVAAPYQALVSNTATNLQAIGGTLAGMALPYQTLASNAVNNLQAVGSAFAADPVAFINSQIGVAQTVGSSIGTGIQSLPATIQTGIQGLSTFNPGALLQQFVNNQIGYAQTIGTALQTAGPDLIAGLQTLPTGFQAAFQDLLAGNPGGAYGALNSSLINAFLPGFHDITVELGGTTPVPVVPLGALGDLAPIFAIPGQMAQNFTNLLPPGSIPAQIAQDFTNVVNALTDFNTTITGSLVINFGLPLQVVFDSIGAPINAVSALNSSSLAFVGALQAGNASAAAAALLDAPANIANGFLNGQTLVGLPDLTTHITIGGFPLGDLTTSAQLPVGGLLTPLSPVVLNPGGAIPGTTIGGLIPGLLSIGSQLAAVITPLT